MEGTRAILSQFSELKRDYYILLFLLPMLALVPPMSMEDLERLWSLVFVLSKGECRLRALSFFCGGGVLKTSYGYGSACCRGWNLIAFFGTTSSLDFDGLASKGLLKLFLSAALEYAVLTACEFSARGPLEVDRLVRWKVENPAY